MIRNCPVCETLIEHGKFMGLTINDPRSCECSNCGSKLIQNNYIPMSSMKGYRLFRLIGLIFVILGVYFLFVMNNTRLALISTTCCFFVLGLFRWLNDKNLYRWKLADK